MRKLNVFAHTPKCAGSSVTRSIVEAVGSRNVQLVHDRLFEPTVAFNIDPEGFLESFKRDIAANPPSVQFIMGHLYIRKYEDVEDCFRFTFLRDPVDRLISNYYFWRQPDRRPAEKHHLFDYVRDNDLSLLQFARLPYMRWFFTKMFFRDVKMASFDFVGFQEDFDSDVHRLSNALDVPLEVKQVNTGIYDGDASRREALRADRHLLAELRGLLKDDIEFYAQLLQRHKPSKTVQMLGADQPRNAPAAPEPVGSMPSNYYDAQAMRRVVAQKNHRMMIGGLWEELGSLQLDYLRSQGLRPEHRLLDIGCGSLRLGVRAVNFLDPGNYVGTDLNEAFLEVGYQEEILPAGLDWKLPRSNLVTDGEFTFAGIPKQIDVAIAQSVFTHLPLNHLRLCLARLANHLTGPCTFLFTVFLAPEGRESDTVEQYPGIVTHPHKDPYHYRVEDIHHAAAGLPWTIEFIGPWGHPRNQMRVRARLKKEEQQIRSDIAAQNLATRDLSAQEARNLHAGAEHYTAYVGPPTQWDFMGATQFRLLTALGLREHHKVLDLGCGSLRAGRFLILYLSEGNYHGIEPNTWLVEDAIERELGRDLVRLKRPNFSSSNTFDTESFGAQFDFIVAQSIFSHAGPELVRAALQQFRKTLAPDGLALVTFIHPAKMPDVPIEAPGWTYPGCTTYEPARIMELISAAGLAGRQLPWYHPRQTWYVLGTDPGKLPLPELDRHLSGAVLRDPEFVDSISSA